MATQWQSDLFVYADQKGQHYVAAALPVGAVMVESSIKHYHATGPYQPIGFPAPKPVDDPAAWIKEHQTKGFTFTVKS